jgi:hypothetical protein
LGCRCWQIMGIHRRYAQSYDRGMLTEIFRYQNAHDSSGIVADSAYLGLGRRCNHFHCCHNHVCNKSFRWVRIDAKCKPWLETSIGGEANKGGKKDVKKSSAMATMGYVMQCNRARPGDLRQGAQVLPAARARQGMKCVGGYPTCTSKEAGGIDNRLDHNEKRKKGNESRGYYELHTVFEYSTGSI